MIVGARIATLRLDGLTANTVFTVPEKYVFIGLTAINRSVGTETFTIRNASGGFPILPAGFVVNGNSWRGTDVPMFMYEADHDLELFASDWTDMSIDVIFMFHDLTGVV